MSAKQQFSGLGRLFITTAALIIILAGIKASSSILIPFLLAVFIATVAEMPLAWMQNKSVPRWLGLIIVLFAGLLIEVLLIAVIGSTINNFMAAFPVYQDRMITTLQNLRPILTDMGIIVDQTMYNQLIERFDPGAIMGLLSTVLSGLGNIFSNGFIIFLTVIFILLEIPCLPAKLEKTRMASAEVSQRLTRFSLTLRNYLGIKTAVSFLTGLLITLWLSFLEVDFPVLWGFLAFLLNFVPNIGSIIAAIPAVLLAFLQGGLDLGLMTALGFAIVNLVIGNVVEPKIMGRGLGLSTLVVFLSLIFWGWLLGPVGMLLSVPLTMFIKVAIEDDEELGWLAVLLGNGEETKENVVAEKT